ncbi:DUF2577 family protein [Bacillus sp. JJ722]|uniref:DUF2577 family protein n=1 Tax=Bacillus sp. JJ722 TaxID=3122973 RepID=UPI002FFEF52E
MDGIIELAKMFKKNENQPYDGYFVGRVIADFPDIKIEIDKNIILDKSHLVFAASLLKGYTREYEIFEADVQFTDSQCGSTTVESLHSHGIESLNVDTTTLKSKGKIKWTDTIKKDDEVILVPSQNSQSFIVIDEAVTFDVSGD